MPGTWTAKKWTKEHDKLLQLLLETDQAKTPKELAADSEDFNREIYSKFAYGTINNKVKGAKKRVLSQGTQGT